MEFNQLISALDSGKIIPYQIYNLDIDYPQVFSVNHYIKNKKDNIDQDQKLHKVFLDIEVISDNQFDFDDIESGKYPISSFTLFSSVEKVFNCFFLLTQKCIDNWNSKTDHVDYFKKHLIDYNYLKENEFNINLKTYTSDMQLLKDAWQKIHELDPIIVSGWNSNGFDLPYIFYRLKSLYNGDVKSVSKIMSKFGDISINKWGGNRGTVRLNEFVNADLAYLYRPRSDSGLNLGKKLASFSLDFVSEEVLGKKKLDYKSNNMTLDQFYETDPINYLLYNIIDVCLCVMLDRKLKHIDQYNMYRRLMCTTYGESLRGSTALFDTMVLYNLTENNECVRYGLNDETTLTIKKEEIDQLPKPIVAKDIKWNISSIDNQTYLKITRKFEGA